MDLKHFEKAHKLYKEIDKAKEQKLERERKLFKEGYISLRHHHDGLVYNLEVSEDEKISIIQLLWLSSCQNLKDLEGKFSEL